MTEVGLVTKAEARAYLGVESTDDPTDDQLDPIILGLSRRIEQRTGKVYVNPTADDDSSQQLVLFFGSDDPVADIPPTRNITLVEATGDPQDPEAWEQLETVDWIAEPLEEAVSTRLRFLRELPMRTSGWSGLALAYRGSGVAAGGITRWPREDRAAIKLVTYLRITGKAGYGADESEVPSHIKLALFMWLENIWKRDQAFFSDNVSRATISMRMPGDVEELLAGEDSSEGVTVEAI